MRRASAGLALFLFVMSSTGRAETLPGPALVKTETLWQSFGLHIEAVRNVTLVSVGYPNQGLDAVIELRSEANAVLASINVIGTPLATVQINYPLTAGSRYKLVVLSSSNSHYALFTSFPQENDDIRVLSSWGGYSDPTGVEQPLYWMAFNDLETSDPSHIDATTWTKIKALYH